LGNPKGERIVANIGTFTAQNDGFTGTVRTLTLNVKVKFIPYVKASENGNCLVGNWNRAKTFWSALPVKSTRDIRRHPTGDVFARRGAVVRLTYRPVNETWALW